MTRQARFTSGAGLSRTLVHIFLVAIALLATPAAPTPFPTPQLPASSTASIGVSANSTTNNNGVLSSGPKHDNSAGLGPNPGGAGPAKIEEDTGQVTINRPKEGGDAQRNPSLPIRATIFHGVPGPKACRGGPMKVLEFPAGSAAQHTTELCYDLPDSAGCGNFVANKADGCQARLFSENGCRIFVNLAVFQPEDRAVGGQWRSMAVRCGVPEPDPATLGAPPLAGMMAKQTRKKKGNKRRWA